MWSEVVVVFVDVVVGAVVLVVFRVVVVEMVVIVVFVLVELDVEVVVVLIVLVLIDVVVKVEVVAEVVLVYVTVVVVLLFVVKFVVALGSPYGDVVVDSNSNSHQAVSLGPMVVVVVVGGQYLAPRTFQGCKVPAITSSSVWGVPANSPRSVHSCALLVVQAGML